MEKSPDGPRGPVGTGSVCIAVFAGRRIWTSAFLCSYMGCTNWIVAWESYEFGSCVLYVAFLFWNLFDGAIFKLRRRLGLDFITVFVLRFSFDFKISNHFEDFITFLYSLSS